MPSTHLTDAVQFVDMPELKKVLEILHNLQRTQPGRFGGLGYKIQKTGYREESRVKNFFSYDGPDTVTRNILAAYANSWAQYPRSFWQHSTVTTVYDVSPARLVELYINAQCDDA
ncbi:hypothetical protein LTR56_016464 [Elasticomyces elasticus]|nr:hypothetical protein LTR56_016464 [Elasticomyces elasticus]KAK3633471.1 hypothetical protein LTR22_020091 [Elasticomyces elasticus]